jgi:hypothetical protein
MLMSSLCVLGWDTTCELIALDWDSFVGGTAEPYNGDLAVYELTVADGDVSELAEIYLP